MAEDMVEGDVVQALNDICERVQSEALAYQLDDRAAVVAWDTETTGLNGVVVQIGTVVLDRGGSELLAHSRMLAPLPNWPISDGAFCVHGITSAKQRAEGEPVKEALEAFAELAELARARGVPLVAHNAAFDKRMLRNTAREAGLEAESVQRIEGIESLCTMTLGKRVMEHRTGRKKRPRNQELFELLVGSLPTGTHLHDATEDARLTAHSYLSGRREGFW